MLKNFRIMFFFLILSLFPITVASAQQDWPDWFSQVEQWVNDRLISQQEFNNAKEFLIEQGILQSEQKEILKEEKTFRIEIQLKKKNYSYLNAITNSLQRFPWI